MRNFKALQDLGLFHLQGETERALAALRAEPRTVLETRSVGRPFLSLMRGHASCVAISKEVAGGGVQRLTKFAPDLSGKLRRVVKTGHKPFQQEVGAADTSISAYLQLARFFTVLKARRFQAAGFTLAPLGAHSHSTLCEPKFA